MDSFSFSLRKHKYRTLRLLTLDLYLPVLQAWNFFSHVVSGFYYSCFNLPFVDTLHVMPAFNSTSTHLCDIITDISVIMIKQSTHCVQIRQIEEELGIGIRYPDVVDC